MEKEISFFTKQKVNKDGISNICKECNKIKCKKYNEENKGKIKERKKETYQKNKEKAKDYYIKNKDREGLRNKKYNEENKGKIEKYRKERYLNNKETYKKFYSENKENILIRQRKRYSENKENILIRQRKRYSENKENILIGRRIKHSERIKNDILYRLSLNIRTSIRESLKSTGFRKCKKTEEILGISIIEFKKYLESKFEYWMNWENRGLYNGELKYGWDIDHIIPLSSAKTEEELIKLNNYTNLQPLCSRINRDIKRDILDFNN